MVLKFDQVLWDPILKIYFVRESWNHRRRFTNLSFRSNPVRLQFRHRSSWKHLGCQPWGLQILRTYRQVHNKRIKFYCASKENKDRLLWNLNKRRADSYWLVYWITKFVNQYREGTHRDSEKVGNRLDWPNNLGPWKCSIQGWISILKYGQASRAQVCLIWLQLWCRI